MNKPKHLLYGQLHVYLRDLELMPLNSKSTWPTHDHSSPDSRSTCQPACRPSAYGAAQFIKSKYILRVPFHFSSSSVERRTDVYIYICCIKKTVLVKKRHFYVKKLLFYKLSGCKNTAFLQKYIFVKKQLFYVKKLLFYKLAACKNTAFLCKKAAFLQNIFL